MKLDVLMSCMNQENDALVKKSCIVGNLVVINQCRRDGEWIIENASGRIRWIDSTTKGLSVSRNLAILASDADVCLLCDDDEVFDADYEQKILDAYSQLPDADVIAFKMIDHAPSFPDRVIRLRFPKTMKVSSVQMSFRRKSVIDSGVFFDEDLGAGTGNGAEEELKFLTDCEKAGLKIYYVPEEIASFSQDHSTWFSGFDETFFYNRGATTRYILGYPLALLYACYYIIRKRALYRSQISSFCAMKALLRGMWDNKISKKKRKQ